MKVRNDNPKSEAVNNMYNLISRYFALNRTPVSEATNKLTEHICDLLNCRYIDVPSGKECLTWIIPKHWNVHEGYLARMDGTKIIDFKKNPLHLWTHSVSFKGEVSREKLEEHLFYNKERPDWIPYHYRNGYRYDVQEWGFCLSYNQYRQLTDSKYIVCIDADLDNNGSMKIVDYWLKGSHVDTIFFAAHTCHPAIATDGLSCVAVATELFRELKTKESLRYSYRLILGPEYFAGAAFLSTVSETEIKVLRGGIYLDMLGNSQPFGYQLSFQGNSYLDKIVQNVFKYHVKSYISRPYRKLWGNDEMFYNGPGYLIPTLGIGGAPYDEYHFDQDNLEFLDCHQLEQARQLLLKIIDVVEMDYVPVLQYRGPLYQSRFGVYVDPKLDSKGYESIEAIQILIDGKRSCFDISHELDIDFFFVRAFCDQLSEKELLQKSYKNLLNIS